MRVLVLTTGYPSRSAPSAAIFIHRQTRALMDLGIECEVIQPVTWAPPGALARLSPTWQAAAREHHDMVAELDGVSVHHPRTYLPLPSRFFPGDYWERTGRSVLGYVRRRRRLREADLLYAHFLSDEGYAGLVAARALGMPLVAIARGDDVHAWPLRWPDRQEKLKAVLAAADGVLANSHALATDAARWSSLPLKRPIEVVYNGVDCRAFTPPQSARAREAIRARLGLPKDRCLLLCVAWLSPAKGWLDLFDALATAAIEAVNWTLVAVTTPYANGLDLASEADRRGIRDRVLLLGTVAPDAMADVYRACDAFVLASHGEGISNAVLEAMASGLPVVTTDVGGHAEIITDRVSGRLVPPQQPATLGGALRDVLTDQVAALRMGEHARQRAAGVGDYRTNAQRLCRYFESIVQASQRTQQRGTPIDRASVRTGGNDVNDFQ